MAVDLDYYSSTRAALDGLLTGPPDRYLPAVVMYADDVEYQITYNAFCGETLAMNEFSAASATRKIERKVVRVQRRPQRWHRQMYCCHVLDHPARNRVGHNLLGDAAELHVGDY